MARFPLRRLRLRPGEEHREAVRLSVEPFSLGGQLYALSADEIPAELVVQRASTGDIFRLGFEATVEGPCMRCLADAVAVVDVEAREYQATDPGADGELRSDYVVEGDLDLDAWSRDLIGLGLPDQILCRADCAGLCPVCGKDLNIEPHEHDEAPVDSRWAALEALRGDGAAE
jgi:uncharacterized protein